MEKVLLTFFADYINRKFYKIIGLQPISYKTKSRKQEVICARKIIIFFLTNRYRQTSHRIAEILQLDHSTVIFHKKRINFELENMKNLYIFGVKQTEIVRIINDALNIVENFEDIYDEEINYLIDRK